jgi:hypothetical protein
VGRIKRRGCRPVDPPSRACIVHGCTRGRGGLDGEHGSVSASWLPGCSCCTCSNALGARMVRNWGVAGPGGSSASARRRMLHTLTLVALYVGLRCCASSARPRGGTYATMPADVFCACPRACVATQHTSAHTTHATHTRARRKDGVRSAECGVRRTEDGGRRMDNGERRTEGGERGERVSERVNEWMCVRAIIAKGEEQNEVRDRGWGSTRRRVRGYQRGMIPPAAVISLPRPCC